MRGGNLEITIKTFKAKTFFETKRKFGHKWIGTI